MTIKKIMNGVPPFPFLEKREKEKGAGADFETLLREAGPSSRSSGQTTRVPRPHQPIEVQPAWMAELQGSLLLRSQGIEATEHTLSLLEEYQRAIDDPRMSLKGIEPLVESLSQEVRNLNLLSEKLSPSDPLQKIVTETGIVSTVEIERFRRGEYV